MREIIDFWFWILISTSDLVGDAARNSKLVNQKETNNWKSFTYR